MKMPIFTTLVSILFLVGVFIYVSGFKRIGSLFLILLLVVDVGLIHYHADIPVDLTPLMIILFLLYFVWNELKLKK